MDIVAVFTAAPLSEVRRFFTTLTGSSDDIESLVAALTVALAVLVGLSGVDAEFNFFALLLVEASELVSESEESDDDDDEDEEELDSFFFFDVESFCFGASLTGSDSESDESEEEEELKSFFFFFDTGFFCFWSSIPAGFPEFSFLK